ncbi:hypothetical protein HDV01_005153 [Terramyces sp. JEL0728]|nr:hypothetical protein HDV01_005153 [Terramyces sp. JEL0728]
MKIREIQLISRSEPDTRLKDYDLHVDLFKQIQEKPNSLDYRKLREILLFTNRRDLFAVKVIKSNVYYCIMEKDWKELLVCLLSVINLLEHNAGNQDQIEMAAVENDSLEREYQEMIGYLILLKTRQTQSIQNLLFSNHKNIQFYLAIKQNNFYKLSILYQQLNGYEKTIIKGSFELQILNALKKCFYTLPVDVVIRFMVIEESEIGDYGIHGPIVELKKKK